MMKKVKNLKLKVLFNASVVLSGLRSPNGGSGKLLQFVKQGKINGKISEIIYDEILRHHKKLGISKNRIQTDVSKLFKDFLYAPTDKLVKKYKGVVIDEGDCHVLASCEEEKIRYLVTLDKKHLLILKGKIKGLSIFTPGELIQKLF
ncbi:MAG: hypothetical protein ACD_19C00426G0063 [uncultured bacterium]|nr:MAG: hypothetical protein ACD_19C00426G0063 [uncultured bacterium]